MNLEFKLKRVGGLLGYFAGTFRWILHMFGTPIIVDSSIVLIFLTHSCLRLHWPVPSGNFVYPSVLSAPLTLPQMCEAMSSCLHIFLTITSISWHMREGDRAYQANRVGCQPHCKEENRVYMVQQNSSIYNNWFWSIRLCSRKEVNIVWAV